jgi:hypothetical protein
MDDAEPEDSSEAAKQAATEAYKAGDYDTAATVRHDKSDVV